VKAPFDQTIWYGGQTENMTWEDDGSSPSVNDLGNCTIDLMYNDNTVNFCKVITLAMSIDAKSLLFACPLPTTLGPESDQ
ncbi:18978_t:CDS:2, partial [Racocetra persica]